MNFRYAVTGSIYQCNVESSLVITSRETATIDSASQGHGYLYSNNDVYGFVADYKTLKYFPQGLEKIFKNLQLLRVRFAFILEITQSDLKPFSQLKELDLHENKITILEDGLFDYNPKLVFVSFSSNKIFQIGLKVFDNLSSLRHLHLSKNECIDGFAKDNQESVIILVKRATEQCKNTELTTNHEPKTINRKIYSSLQIMIFIIFVLTMIAVGGIFYYFLSFGNYYDY